MTTTTTIRETTVSESNSASGGVGFLGLLQIAFIVLKLTHYIAWSWLWVLSPTWISIGLAALIFAAIGLAAMFAKPRLW